jgi:hypothetical protein
MKNPNALARALASPEVWAAWKKANAKALKAIAKVNKGYERMK